MGRKKAGHSLLKTSLRVRPAARPSVFEGPDDLLRVQILGIPSHTCARTHTKYSPLCFSNGLTSTAIVLGDHEKESSRDREK